MKSVILAGGLGTRLQPYTTFLPKPMLPLGEKPILEHLIEWCNKNGVKSIVLCVSYLRKTIEDYFEDILFGYNEPLPETIEDLEDRDGEHIVAKKGTWDFGGGDTLSVDTRIYIWPVIEERGGCDEFISNVQKQLDRLSRRKNGREETEKLVEKMLTSFDFEPRYRNLYYQRLKYGLANCFTKRYLQKENDKNE